MTASITVLMSVYNGLPYLAEAIESILKQTFVDFEFIIVDDASTDGSHHVLASYARQDPRIKIVTNDRNRGLGYSLARGVELARTPWIARMDADDIAVLDRLKLQMEYLKEHPDIDILGGQALNIQEDGTIIDERKVPTSDLQIRRLLWTNPFNHGTVIFRREAILSVGSYSRKNRKRQDYELWFRCAIGGLQFANLSVPLLHYRFTDKTFQNNSFLAVTLPSVIIGWKGCWMIKASPIAYLGVMKPLFIGLLPLRFRSRAYFYFKKFDPRMKVNNQDRDRASGEHRARSLDRLTK